MATMTTTISLTTMGVFTLDKSKNKFLKHIASDIASSSNLSVSDDDKAILDSFKNNVFCNKIINDSPTPFSFESFAQKQLDAQKQPENINPAFPLQSSSPKTSTKATSTTPTTPKPKATTSTHTTTLQQEILQNAKQSATRGVIGLNRRQGRITRALLTNPPRPIKPDDNPVLDPEVKLSTLLFSLRFAPYVVVSDIREGGYKINKRHKEKAFAVRCDLLNVDNNTKNETTRFYSYEDMQACEDKWVQWVLKYTTISKGLFDIALENPFCSFTFAPKWEKIVKDAGSPSLIVYDYDLEDEDKKKAKKKAKEKERERVENDKRGDINASK